jgi:Na+/H+-dicarboxylate symporter
LTKAGQGHMRIILSRALGGLKLRAIQVPVLLTIYFLIAHLLPLEAHQGLYTISMFIKDLLMWTLPVTVGLFIAQAICSFEQRALLFVCTLVLFEALSNFISVWYAFFGGYVAVDYMPPIEILSGQQEGFNAFWRLPLMRPAWWSADKGALLGLFLGSFAAISKKAVFKLGIDRGKEAAQWILTNVFARFIPFFILGFVARMYQMGLFQHIFAEYGMLLIWLVAFLSGYLMLLFLIGSSWSLKETAKAIKNLFPAGVISFTSGCSISTMPWTIEGAAKNLNNPYLAKAVIPATTNIQQIGDCITNTFLCFLIYRHFYGHSPDFITWTSFSIIFVLARFATAAVIGGAIFIMLPIYEKYLSFNAEMIAIILAFNVILDPLITSSNVIANGALCRIFEKVWGFVLGNAQTLFPKLVKKNDLFDR